jgi:hypothetical protein
MSFQRELALFRRYGQLRRHLRKEGRLLFLRAGSDFFPSGGWILPGWHITPRGPYIAYFNNMVG